MLLALQVAFFIVAVVLAYLYWVRPVLRLVPDLADILDRTDNFFKAVRLRFEGIKTLLVAAAGKAFAVIVAIHDFLLPYALGVDWSPIMSWLPSWAWPLLFFGFAALIGWFRKLTDRRAEA